MIVLGTINCPAGRNGLTNSSLDTHDGSPRNMLFLYACVTQFHRVLSEFNSHGREITSRHMCRQYFSPRAVP